MKKPPTAHTRLTLDFCKYLLPLQKKRKKNKFWIILIEQYQNLCGLNIMNDDCKYKENWNPIETESIF